MEPNEPPAVVAVHVVWMPDLRGAVYTVACIPRTGGPAVGETHVVEHWATGSEAAAWTYASLHAVLFAVEQGHGYQHIVVRGDYPHLGRLIGMEWDGMLGVACLRFRAFFGAVRFQNRGGDRLPTHEEQARVAAYRALLLDHLGVV